MDYEKFYEKLRRDLKQRLDALEALPNPTLVERIEIRQIRDVLREIRAKQRVKRDGDPV